MRRIEKLETETTCKQSSLDNLRREKVELENTLEQEQEALVNKLWKRMDQLETEKRWNIGTLIKELIWYSGYDEVQVFTILLYLLFSSKG